MGRFLSDLRAGTYSTNYNRDYLKGACLLVVCFRQTYNIDFDMCHATTIGASGHRPSDLTMGLHGWLDWMKHAENRLQTCMREVKAGLELAAVLEPWDEYQEIQDIAEFGITLQICDTSQFGGEFQ